MMDKKVIISQPEGSKKIFVFEVAPTGSSGLVVVQAENSEEALALAEQAYKGKNVEFKEIEGTNSLQI